MFGLSSRVYVILTVVTTLAFVAAIEPVAEVIPPDQHHAELDREVLLSDEDHPSSATNLSPEEQKEKLESLVVEKIDTDRDGFVSRQELEVWSLKAFNQFETEETRQEFPSFDEDDDGKVTWKEYADSSFGDDFTEDSEEYKNPPDTEEWKSFIQSYNTEKKLFNVADDDNDGKLTQSEFIAFKHPQFKEATKAAWLDDMLQKTDLDGDGGISLKEFLGEYRRTSDETSDPDWIIAETDRFNEELDVDKDGLLKDDEIANWLASNNHDESIEEADHIISECDTNGDSKLTLQEILDNKELWVSSDVTDYGNLLTKHDEL